MFSHLQISDTLKQSVVPKRKVHPHPVSVKLHYPELSSAFELKQFSSEKEFYDQNITTFL